MVFPNIVAESLIIAVVGYSITLSMAKIFAAKFGYRVDGNQEMFGEVKCWHSIVFYPDDLLMRRD